jgi:hypothetical protein
MFDQSLFFNRKSIRKGKGRVKENIRLEDWRGKGCIFVELSSPGEFHPQALTDPDVTVSCHPAPIIQLLFIAILPCFLAPPNTGVNKAARITIPL